MKPFGARVLLAAVFIARGTSFLFSKQLLTSLSPMSPLTASIMGIIFAHELLSPLKIAGYIIILSTLYIYNSRLGEKK